MSTHVWTDRIGRSYSYEPYAAEPIADADLVIGGDAVLALTSAVSAIAAIPRPPLAGIAAVLFRSESSASSLIEGIGAGSRRVLEAEFAGEGEINDEIGRRVVSNLDGLRAATATSWPATSEDFLHWHHLLTSGHPQLHPGQTGAYRTEQNWIGGDDLGPRHAAFIPPPPEDLPRLIADLEKFCARTDLAPLLQALIAHARFEVIHPFTDGNGRVGRMLLQHLLVKQANTAGPIPISVPWARNKDRYVAGLRAYQDGDVDRWIEFAAGSVLVSVEWLLAVDSSVGELLAKLRSIARVRGTSIAARIIADLPSFPLLDGPSVAARYGVSAQAAHAALSRLEHRGVLVRRSFSRRRRPVGRPRQVLASPKLIALLDELGVA